MEQWKDVKEYENLFSVSNSGKLFSKRTNKILKQFLHDNGYLLVATKIGGKSGTNKTFKIHRVVAEAFLPPPSPELVILCSKTKYGKVLVNHKDGDKTNNNVENLEWCSYSENSTHAISNGLTLPLKGAANGGSFFKSEEERYAAFLEYVNSGLSMRKFAENLGCTHSVISRLVRDYK